MCLDNLGKAINYDACISKDRLRLKLNKAIKLYLQAKRISDDEKVLPVARKIPSLISVEVPFVNRYAKSDKREVEPSICEEKPGNISIVYK